MLLNARVVTDSDPYVPFYQSGLRGSARFPDGPYGGTIEYDSPYAHYQYMGDLYLTEDGRSFAKKYEPKYPTGQPLHYHTTGTGSHWFETAKTRYKEQWIDLVKRTVGKDG